MKMLPSPDYYKKLIIQFQDYITQKGITTYSLKKFDKLINEFHQNNRRPFPWRDKITPYGIVVSEIMLQQTQTHRVLPKYKEFILAFPNFKKLAEASFYDVLKYWKGLGYNRRAKNLQITAQIITQTYQGTIPKTPEILKTFPGIGPATSCSIATFIYNKPYIFIETNIRSVFLLLFFENESKIDDNQILELIEKTIDKKNPREWYYALMDFGVFIKKEFKNPNHKSKHYNKQSTFAGSNRQIRGMILQDLLNHPLSTQTKIIKRLGFDKERIIKNLEDLIKEEMIIKKENKYTIT